MQSLIFVFIAIFVCPTCLLLDGFRNRSFKVYHIFRDDFALLNQIPSSIGRIRGSSCISREQCGLVFSFVRPRDLYRGSSWTNFESGSPPYNNPVFLKAFGRAFTDFTIELDQTVKSDPTNITPKWDRWNERFGKKEMQVVQ